MTSSLSFWKWLEQMSGKKGVVCKLSSVLLDNFTYTLLHLLRERITIVDDSFEIFALAVISCIKVLNLVFLRIIFFHFSTTYITCPADSKKTLGIKLPFLVMIIKNLKKYFTFEVQVYMI